MPTRRGFLLVGTRAPTDALQVRRSRGYPAQLPIKTALRRGSLHAGISDAAHRCLKCGILGSSMPRRLAAGSPALSPIGRGFSRGTRPAAC
jgi:hypothetical protein